MYQLQVEVIVVCFQFVFSCEFVSMSPQGAQHHLGRADRLDICLLIPVLRFLKQCGLDPDEGGIHEIEDGSEEANRIAEESAKQAHIKNAIMAGLYFGADKTGKPKKLAQVLEEKRQARMTPVSSKPGGAGGDADGLTGGLLKALRLHVFAKDLSHALAEYKQLPQTNPAVLFAQALCLLATGGASRFKFSGVSHCKFSMIVGRGSEIFECSVMLRVRDTSTMAAVFV